MRNRRAAGGRVLVAGGILVLLAGCASTPMAPTVQVMPAAPPPPSASPAPSPAPAVDSMVRATQSELVRLGYLADPPDGIMGPKTRGAIVQFQQTFGLPVDGAPSRRLLATLQSTPTGGAPPMAATPASTSALGGRTPPKTQ
jgi:peptidoglycan hydrolase-like protein with peptidoglycan-binding domain